jgi:hypothetical protein
MKTALIAVLLAMPTVASAQAQDQAAAARAAGGCGPEQVEFDVKTDKTQHAPAQPDPGKALVVVLEHEKSDPGFKIGAVTTRIGLDGAWVGANHGASFLAFPVDPGDHRVCAQWQSTFKRYSKLASAASLYAEAGQIYYFETRVDERSHDQPAVRIDPLDPAEAQILLATAAQSVSHPKK